MNEGLLDVRSYQGEGYQALVDYGSWRVGVLRFEEGLLAGKQSSMERHMETDEVFVLIQGKGALILGGNEREVGTLSLRQLEIGTVYNVKRGGWHTVSLSRDASVIVVENCDTTRDNSEYQHITEEQRRWIAGAIGSYARKRQLPAIT